MNYDMDPSTVVVYAKKTVVDIDKRDVPLVFFGFLIRLWGLILFRWYHPFIVVSVGFFGLDIADSIFVYFFARFVRFGAYEFMDKIMDYAFHSAMVVWPIMFDTTEYRWPILMSLLSYRLLGDVIFFLGRKRYLYIFFPNMFIWAYLWFTLVDFVGIETTPAIDIAPLSGFLVVNLAVELFIHKKNAFGLQQKTKIYVQKYLCGRYLYMDKQAQSDTGLPGWMAKRKFDFTREKEDDEDYGFDYVI